MKEMAEDDSLGRVAVVEPSGKESAVDLLHLDECAELEKSQEEIKEMAEGYLVQALVMSSLRLVVHLTSFLIDSTNCNSQERLPLPNVVFEFHQWTQ